MWSLIDLPQSTDPRGWLVPCEFSALPFVPVRAYWLKGDETATRGMHAHLVEHELFICISGHVTAELEDARGTAHVRLDSPKKGVLIPTGVWHQFQDFSPDCVLLALSSTAYMPGDQNYLTDRDAFRASLPPTE